MDSSHSIKGFVLFHRKFWDNPILKELGKPFSKREAWLYLFSNLANGIDRNGIPRGEFEASERFLSKKWLWDKAKVHRFIQLLESEHMIERANRNDISMNRLANHPTNHFIICNYETYQNMRTADRTTKRTKSKEGIKESIKELILQEPVFIKIPTKDTEEYQIPESLVLEYEKSYQGVDVRDNLRRVRIWSISNPDKRWKYRGTLQGINKWLNREYTAIKNQRVLSELKFGNKL